MGVLTAPFEAGPGCELLLRRSAREGSPGVRIVAEASEGAPPSRIDTFVRVTLSDL